MIQHIIEEKKRLWIIIAYIIVSALIYSIFFNKLSTLEFLMASIFFSIGMAVKLLMVLLPFIVIEDKLACRPKWSRRILRLIALLLTSLAYTWLLNSTILFCNYFILWFTFGKKEFSKEPN